MTRIFISYSRKDYDDFVNSWIADLQAEGHPVWVDKIGLPPGTPDWEQAIRDAIRAASAVLLIATEESRRSKVVRDELAVAEMEGKPIYPVWAKGADGRYLDCIPLGFSSRQMVDARGARYGAALREISSSLRGEGALTPLEREAPPAPTSTIIPYRGLAAFREADRGLFFGREDLTATLKQRVEALAGGESRLLAVVGASGSGKSSVVMAGLIPALRDAGGWTLIDPITPGEKPLKALALALGRHSSRGLMALMDDLGHASAQGLDLTARDIVPDGRLLLYIDQFEELFTLTQTEHERQQVVNLLATAATEPGSPLVIVLSLRADFYDRPMNYPELGALIGAGNQSVLPLTLAELADAVERPAALAGLRFEPGLVNEIVFALRGRSGALAGALPLLQFALERLHEERDGERLTLAAYERIGGVAGAIGTHAAAVFDTLDADAQAQFEPVFLELVKVDEDGTPTRKRASLAAVTSDPAAQRLVETLVQARLLQTGGGEAEIAYVEVAHEALFSTWGHLAQWLERIKEGLQLIERVHRAAHEWETAGRPDYLLWKWEQQEPCLTAFRQMQIEPDELTQAFLIPEYERLLEEFKTAFDYRQRAIVDRWREMGEPCKYVLPMAMKSLTGYSDLRVLNELINAVKIFALDLLVPILEESQEYDELIFTAIIAELAKLGDDRVVAILNAKLKDEDKYIRQAATEALGEIGNFEAVKPLISALQVEEEGDSRQVIILALGKLINDDSIAAILTAFTDEDESVRNAVVTVLGNIRSPFVVDHLIMALDDTSSSIRQKSVQMLAGFREERVAQALIRLLEDENPFVRETTANVLGKLNLNLAAQALIKSLKDENVLVRGSVAEALGKLKSKKATQALIQTLKDEHKDVSINAATALEGIGTPKALAALERWRQEHPDWYQEWHRQQDILKVRETMNLGKLNLILRRPPQAE